MARRIRDFDRMPMEQKVAYLVNLVLSVLREDPVMRKRWRTDYIGIAVQYGGAQKIKRKDFDLIKGLTIDQLFDLTKPS